MDQSYFNSQNIYRVEWEPPTPGKNDGYIRWYLNGKFVFGIKGESLNITGTSIPSEPMYMIMNTAVASSWGFPVPCPDGCTCECYECNNPDCDCALPVGYCDNFPSYFEIDYVRVWQAVNETKHQLGCSTKDRPTEKFILAHEDRYKEKYQKTPLKEIVRGGAPCTSSLDCGGDLHGICTEKGVCECTDTYSGSKCLSHYGFNDEDYGGHDPPLEGKNHTYLTCYFWFITLKLNSFQLSFILSVADPFTNVPRRLIWNVIHFPRGSCYYHCEQKASRDEAYG
jgi:hypothetical protein